MSHIVSIKTLIHDPAAIAAACQRLGLTMPIHGHVQLFAGEASGLLLRLPEWQYPAVIDLATGNVSYDNFEGRWGEQKHLDRFLQMYAVEMAKIQARKHGHSVTEQQLQDGSIKLQIQEAV